MKKYILSTFFVLSLFLNVLKPKKYLVEVKNKERLNGQGGYMGRQPCPCHKIHEPVCGTDGKNNYNYNKVESCVQANPMATHARQNVKESRFSAKENVPVGKTAKFLQGVLQCVALTV